MKESYNFNTFNNAVNNSIENYKKYPLKKKRVLYGCCFKAELKDYGCFDIDYVDIIPGIKKSNGNYICKDIREIDFTKYDIIILTPPCNYYSRANWRRESSNYAQLTKDLLPYCVRECNKLNIPFIIENVRSPKLFEKAGLFNFMYYVHGRHTYFSNVLFNPYIVPQRNDFKQSLTGQIRIKYDDELSYSDHGSCEGGKNVNGVFDEFLKLFIDN